METAVEFYGISFSTREVAEILGVSEDVVRRRYGVRTENCVVCGRRLKRKTHETLRDFAKRKTCNRACGNRSSVLTNAARVAAKIPARNCSICGEALQRGEGERPHLFVQRKTCGGGSECWRKSIGKKNTTTKIVSGRRCLVCGAVLERGKSSRLPGYESPFAFARRETCGGRKCAGVLAGSRHPRATKIVEGRRCAACDSILVQHQKESGRDFMRRKTCSATCGNKLKTTKIPTDRRCLACDSLLEMRAGEVPANFVRRKVCDQTCAAELKKRRVSFYGVILPVGEVATILGVSTTTVRYRREKGVNW